VSRAVLLAQLLLLELSTAGQLWMWRAELQSALPVSMIASQRGCLHAAAVVHAASNTTRSAASFKPTGEQHTAAAWLVSLHCRAALLITRGHSRLRNCVTNVKMYNAILTWK
jgi:hypothetical protein